MTKEELEIFNRFKDNIKVVFDIGARTDMVYKDVEVHYFEPNPLFAIELKGIVNVYGLSDKDGVGTYYTETQSFVKKGKGELKFPLRTLDGYGKHADFIKIDAEGMDYQILQGGKETLKKTKYIQFEYWDGVQKFVDLLPDFDLFLILDENLYSNVVKSRVSDEKYKQLLVPLEKDVVYLIDNICIPLGAGGNIFGIKK